MFTKLVARYVYKDEKNDFVASIGCSILTTSGEYLIELARVKNMSLLPSERYTFKDRNEANEKFKELRKMYDFKKVF